MLLPLHLEHRYSELRVPLGRFLPLMSMKCPSLSFLMALGWKSILLGIRMATPACFFKPFAWKIVFTWLSLCFSAPQSHILLISGMTPWRHHSRFIDVNTIFYNFVFSCFIIFSCLCWGLTWALCMLGLSRSPSDPFLLLRDDPWRVQYWESGEYCTIYSSTHCFNAY